MFPSSTAARGRLLAPIALALALGLTGSAALAQEASDPAPAGPGEDAGGTDAASAAAGDGAATDGATDGAGAATSPAAGDGVATPAGVPGPIANPAEPDASKMPVNLRLRRLEQRVQALKERAWRAKARVGMLKEAVLGGGVGASASIVHKNKMGSSFRLVQMVYALDGTQIFARKDDSGDLHKSKEIEVLTGPIAPGSHTLSVLLVYRGHGYGVFKYLNKYRFTVRSSHTFTATEGKATRVDVVGLERGGVTTPLEKRPAVDFKVSAGGAGS